MKKEQLLAALNAMQNGEDAGKFHDELEMSFALVTNVSDEDVYNAWKFLRDEPE